MIIFRNIALVAILFFFVSLFYSCSSSTEKKTHNQITTLNYDTGELMIRKTVEYNDENQTDSIKSIIYENFDKSGECILKYHQEISEENPQIWDIEKLSNRDSFADDEEKEFFNELYELIGENDPAYQKEVKFLPQWVVYESEFGYKSLFPADPDISQKDINLDITVNQATCSNAGYNFSVIVFKNSAATDDHSFNEFFEQLNVIEPSMTVEEDKDIEVSGVIGKYKKLIMNKDGSKVYSRVVQLPYKMHVISISVVGFTQYPTDDLFNRFIEGFSFLK